MTRDNSVGESKSAVTQAQKAQAAAALSRQAGRGRCAGAGPDWLWTRWRARQAPWDDVVGLARRCVAPPKSAQSRKRDRSGPRGLSLAVLALAAWASTAGGAQAACQPPSYCNQPGACLNIQSIKSQAAGKYGGQGYSVASVRLRPHGRTATCLLYEVTLQHPSRGARVVYWNILGGEFSG